MGNQSYLSQLINAIANSQAGQAVLESEPAAEDVYLGTPAPADIGGELLGGFVPGLGDLMSLRDAIGYGAQAVSDFQNYEDVSGFKNAGLSGLAALGALPLIPSVTKAVKAGNMLPEMSNPIDDILRQIRPADDVEQTLREAHAAGFADQGKILNRDYYGPEWLMSDYAEDPMLGRAQRQLYEIGRKGQPFPDRVVASRWGEIPAEGVSYNFRDQYPEKGTSVLGTYDNTSFNAQNDGTYELFNKGQKKHIAGYLHPIAVGSDGEPLLLYPQELPDSLIALLAEALKGSK